jgi:hypothetical protein
VDDCFNQNASTIYIFEGPNSIVSESIRIDRCDSLPVSLVQKKVLIRSKDLASSDQISVSSDETSGRFEVERATSRSYKSDVLPAVNASRDLFSVTHFRSFCYLRPANNSSPLSLSLSLCFVPNDQTRPLSSSSLLVTS